MKEAARWTVIIALFAIPLLPLYVSNELFFPFITGKGFAFRILVEVALAGYMLLALVDRDYRPRFSWTLLAFGALTAWMFVADAMSVNPAKAFWSNFERMDGFVTLIHLFAFFIIASAVLSIERLWKKWWLAVIGVSAVVCAYGALQLLGAPGFDIHQGGARVDATFGNAIYLAVYLMFAFFVTAWRAIEATGWPRALLACLLVLQTIILIAASSRGAVIGLVAGIGVAAALWLFESLKDWKRMPGAKAAAMVLAMLLLAAGSFFLVRDSAFVRNEPALARLSTVFALEGELKVRSIIWGMALKGAGERPLFGYGQEGFNQVFNTHYEPSLYQQEAWFDRAHNMYIDWLIAGGIPALLLFVALIGTAVLALYRSRTRSRAERSLLIAALAAYAVQAIVVFDNLWSYVPFAAILAMAHAASSRPSRKLAALPELRGESATAIAAATAVAVAIALVWIINVPSIRAAHHLVYAISPIPGGPQANQDYFRRALADGSFASQEIREQLSMFATGAVSKPGISAEQSASLVSFALSEMRDEIERSPNDARLRLQYASLLDVAGDTEGALRETETALALSPKKQAIHIKRGLELLALGRTEEGKASLRAAYDLDPTFTEVAVSAAVGQIATGDVAGGKALLREVLATTTIDNDQLFYAYYQAKAYPDLIAVAETRVRATGGDPNARFRLAQAYAVAGRDAEARREIAFTVAAHPQARAVGEALLEQITSMPR